MSEAKKPYPDPLVRQRLFPDASHIFEFGPVDLATALIDGIVVVDTNVLLIPYTTGRASLDQIRGTYERLVSSGQLRIPGQVAREFADNRAEKLKTLFQQLSKKREVHLARSEYPLLEGIPAYADVSKSESEIVAALSQYRKAIGTLLETVAAWRWDDPVSQIYRQFFKASVVVDPEIDHESLLKDLKYRQEHRVPPGYKDASNEYTGVGDFLIWKTILKIGENEGRHLVFVSGDEKTDWRYQSENTSLYPRFELLDEYRVASKGKSFLIISFAELLKEYGAPAAVVTEVRQEEAVASLAARTPHSRGTEVEFSIDFQKVKMQSERHDYRLQVRLKNIGTRPITEWHVDVGVPTPLLEAGTFFATRVPERSNARHTLFRGTPDIYKGAIYPGDARLVMSVDYFVDSRLFWDHKDVFDEPVTAVAYVDGELGATTELPVREIQCF